MANSLANGSKEITLNQTFQAYKKQDTAHTELINQILITQEKIEGFLRLLTSGNEGLSITRMNEDGTETNITYDTF